MLLGIQVFQGKDCQLKSGCKIHFDRNTAAQYFTSNNNYYLLEGQVSIQYNFEPVQEISSPYGSNWTPYIDSWDYSKEVKLTVLPSTVFLRLTAPTLNSSSVLVLQNSNTVVSMNPNSTLIVVGTSYTVDGVSYEKTRFISATEAKELSVATSNSCSLVYIERD